MLSEESAIGQYPVEAVAMPAKIAAAIEPRQRPALHAREMLKMVGAGSQVNRSGLIALSVESTLEWITPVVVSAPATPAAPPLAASPASGRRCGSIAVSSLEGICQRLQFTFGVHPLCEPDHPEDSEKLRAPLSRGV